MVIVVLASKVFIVALNSLRRLLMKFKTNVKAGNVLWGD